MNPLSRNRFCPLTALLMIISLLFIGIATVSATENPLIFKWAIRVETPEGLKTIDLSASPRLKTGDAIQIFIEPVQNAHIYLFLLDPGMDLKLLYPPAPVMAGAAHPSPAAYTIPDPPNRFELCPPNGTEKFYLLASETRLNDLETATRRFLSNPDDDDAKAAVIHTIKQQIRDASRFSKSAEKGVPITGTLRTRGTGDAAEVTEVIAEGFYGKVIRMPHED